MAEEDSVFSELYTNPLRVFSIQLNELYQELKTVGFNEREALFLVGQVLVGMMENQLPDDRQHFEDTRDEQDYDDDGEFF